MSFLDKPTPNLFFTGKGGVGKTSSSCATAVDLARRGNKVLLVSTDPASNIDEVFGCEIAMTPTAIAEIPGLFGLNVDPEIAAAEYREKVVGPYRNILPEAAVAAMEEQLAGACTVEIAAFDEFAKLIGKPDPLAEYDHVIFDTAPTGHTLRLLTLPTAWTGFIENASAGTSCLGPLQGLVEQRDLYAAAVAALADRDKTTLILVSRPEASALDEASVTSGELSELGIDNQRLLINGTFEASDAADPVAVALEGIGRQSLDNMPAALRGFERTTVPLKAGQLLGVDALKSFFEDETGADTAAEPMRAPDLPAVGSLVDEISTAGKGVVMTMGKGGVGKTTMAIEIASSLAERGHEVLLTTTDPAGHVAKSGVAVSDNLSIERIDPEVEVARYRDEVLSTTGANRTPTGWPCWRRTCRRPAPKRSPSSRPSRRRWRRRRTASSCLTPRRPATPSCCSTPRSRSTRRSADRPSRCPTRCSGCCRGCAIRPSPGSSCAPCRRPHRYTRRRPCRPICAAPTSSRSAGSSTRAWRR